MNDLREILHRRYFLLLSILSLGAGFIVLLVSFSGYQATHNGVVIMVKGLAENDSAVVSVLGKELTIEPWPYRRFNDFERRGYVKLILRSDKGRATVVADFVIYYDSLILKNYKVISIESFGP